MENPTGETVTLGNFTIDLNENGSITIYATVGSLLIKPLSGNSTILYLATSGKSPTLVHAGE